jgi:uncharacterized protein (TIGR02271 family)
MQSKDEQLKSMRDLRDFQVSREDPDVRGWSVVAADGQRVGTVSDLIVDTDRMKVAYLEVEANAGGGAQMVPVEAVQVDGSQREVMVAGMTNTAGWGETSVRAVDERDGRDTSETTRLTRAEEELRIGRREVNAGEVVVGKHVETERISEPVTVERERVRVERRPVSDRVAGNVEIGADEIRVPVMEEELVVEKRPVVKEELVITKEREQDTRTVDTEIRREEFDVRGNPETLVDESTSGHRGRK